MTEQAAAVLIPEKDQRELLRRTTVGAALILLALGDLWLGGVWFWVLVALAAVLMMGEWAELVKEGRAKGRAQIVMALIMLPIIPLPQTGGVELHDIAILGGGALLLALIARSVRLALGLIYTGLPALALIYIRELDFGHLLAMWTLSLVWATDIGAYFVGRAIGGPKLAPRISPNKTWAGLGGGVLGAIACGLSFYAFDRLPLWMALASGVLALVAQAGDLFESWLKRRAGVKDSGTLLPGHGGVLDRLDGLVPVAPLVAAGWYWWLL